ncbi:MAG: type II secretion system minor pseudopilin GspK [Gemmobacter sp.]
MKLKRQGERGVVLVNVLVVLALMSTVVFAMISLSDLSIARSQRFSEAGQAAALVAAGETSAIIALRRDMVEAPQSDNLTEPWAQIAQEEIRIEAGRFALAIEDAQGRFNLNSLPGSGVLGAQLLQRILAALGMPPDVGLRIGARMSRPERLERLGELVADVGLTEAEVALLSTLVIVLPERTDINVNTAPEELLMALADNPVQAINLLAIRKRQGFLKPSDVTAASMILPTGTGYRTRYFLVTVEATVGDTTRRVHSLLQRQTGAGGRPKVIVLARE